jgi:hyperosmotically inducible protein
MPGTPLAFLPYGKENLMRPYIALAAAFAMGVAYAQPSEKFRSLDRNGDGYLTKDEVSQIQGYDRAFDEADENRDGRLTPDEFIKSESILERQQLGKAVDDGVLTTKVKAALLRERGLKSTDVHVESHQGRVLLSGFVDNDDQKRRALNVASHVSGVKEVRDGINVR